MIGAGYMGEQPGRQRQQGRQRTVVGEPIEPERCIEQTGQPDRHHQRQWWARDLAVLAHHRVVASSRPGAAVSRLR